MKQQGFSLVDALLALTIGAFALALIIPTAMRWGEQIEAKNRLIYAVDSAMYSMEIALREEWSISGCKNTLPSISLTKLIQQYELTPDVVELPWQVIPSYRSNRQMVVSINVTAADSSKIVNWFSMSRYITEVRGNTVDLILRLPLIESQYQNVNFNPQSECFEG
ncbi:hypothetical protein TUM4438_10560 [Shewanella sairae]|uniref:Type II secretion system protein n=1 Tax=Shewanella sairae TaxID=190310 RepID=A0ABQ4P603_9GAMM|nr:type II secretion system protein [Shewanella sairae]MCL1130489.1 type II secretion system GspH family protein [Shewanella sairae]GIU42903.1 hypothetical protein TUM4438_10560 [Shewanella sairae]